MTKYSDRLKFVVCVLWLKGYSLGMISVWVSRVGLRVTVNQVWGIVNKSPYRKRSEMDVNERQNHLDILKDGRLDDGMLKDWVFTADVISTDGAKQ